MSATISSQLSHASPPMPQALKVGGSVQVVPEQQPFAQFVALQPLQMPPLQVPGEQS